jgi:uncharacterized integral membrane protein
MDIRKVLVVLLVILLAAFVLLNLTRAQIGFFGVQVEMPIGLVVLFSAGLGFGLGWLLAFFQTKRKPAQAKDKPKA